MWRALKRILFRTETAVRFDGNGPWRYMTGTLTHDASGLYVKHKGDCTYLGPRECLDGITVEVYPLDGPE